MKKYIFFCLVFFFGLVQLNAQEKIRGYISDSLSGEPLSGAVIYFNATSVGVVTNVEGYFEIIKPEGLVSPIVISFLGYEKIMLEEPFPEEIFNIKMLKAVNMLNPVVLEGKAGKAKRNREETLRVNALEHQKREWYLIFQRIFLGYGEATEKTFIKNKEVFEFTYDPETKTVYVSAKGPIIIENEYLKYRISYNLDSFWFEQTWNGHHYVPSAYSIAGTSFFTDLLDPENISRRRYRKILERRKEAFLGSSFDFMRALAGNQISEAGFSVYTLNADKKRIPARFLLNLTGDYLEVTPPPKFFVSYEDKISLIYAQMRNFKIDEYGNFYPWNALKFEGFLGNVGMSSAVPLNFQI